MKDKYIAEIIEMLHNCDENTLDLIFQILVKQLKISEHTL